MIIPGGPRECNPASAKILLDSETKRPYTWPDYGPHTKETSMIQDVDETLSALLSAELSTIPGCGITGKSQITFDSPSVAEGLLPDSPRLNLYLYDVRENHSARESGLRLTRKPGEDAVGVRRAPINLDLSYLVTAYSGSDAALEHRLLSDALAVLLRSQDIPREFLRGVLEEQGATLAVAQPDHLASADPPALWQALGGRMRPALSLVITAQFNPYETRWTRVVREMVIGVGLGTPPHGPQRPLDLSSIRVGAAGVVLDQVSETPLVGALVSMEGRAGEAATDVRGFFSLLNLPPGPQTLRISRAGYRSQEAKIVAPAPGHPEQLEPCIIALQPVGDEERALETATQWAAAGGRTGIADEGRLFHASLSGVLRRADGRPAAHVSVEAGGKRTTTDADGIYCFLDLPPGPHTVVSGLPGAAKKSS